MAKLFKKPEVVYGMFILSVAVALVHFLGYLPEGVANTLIGLFGFGGLAGLRSWVGSKGWKTYFSAAMAIVGIAIRYLFPEVFTPAELAQWLAFWGVVGTASLAHGVQKANGGAK